MSETTTPEPSTPEPSTPEHDAPAQPVASVEADLAASGVDAEGGAQNDAGAQADASPSGDVGAEADAGVDHAQMLARLEQEGEVAADYLEGLLDIADLDGDIDMDVEGSRAAVSIVGADLSDLVGPDGRVLEALQELTRLAVSAHTGERSRLMLDVSGHRARRREQLREQAASAVEKVRASGSFVRLAPMTPFERKVVHDAVAEAGLRSESEGVEPERRVVVHPAS